MSEFTYKEHEILEGHERPFMEQKIEMRKGVTAELNKKKN